MYNYAHAYTHNVYIHTVKSMYQVNEQPNISLIAMSTFLLLKPDTVLE